MDEIQNTDIQSGREKYGKVTTVRLNKGTRDFLLKNELRLATFINAAPFWYARMIELKNEADEMRDGIKKKDAMLARLWQENSELKEFKAKTLERWKLKA